MNVVYATGIWEGGGLSYLRTLSNFYFTNGAIYILDERIKTQFRPPAESRCLYFSSGLIGRLQILLYRHFLIFPRFLFCSSGSYAEYFLNGIPSLSRLPFISSSIFILCQNKLLFDPKVINEFSFRYRLKLILLRLYFVLATRNIDTILVQTLSMQECISLSLLSTPTFLRLPRFEESSPFELNSKSCRVYSSPTSAPLKLFYPASFLSHKNHSRAFQALNQVYDKLGPLLTLYCTISSQELSSIYSRPGIVVPLGRLSRSEVFDYYQICDYLFFPSLCESLGLPLLESASFNLPVVASDLDYVYESCTPVRTFNPYSVLAITTSLLSLL